MMSSLSFIFVAEGPILEARGFYLAASLLQQHGNVPGIETIAYVGEAKRTSVSELALAVFDCLNVRIDTFPDPDGFWNEPYPHGNKIFAAAAPRSSASSIFLDTDMICVRPLNELDLKDGNTVCVVPEDVPTWGKDWEDWRQLYQSFGLNLPEDRINLVRGRKIEFLPYFNAGFVAFSNVRLHKGLTFAELWKDTARLIDWNPDVRGKRPWLDQISLPVAMKRFGLDYRVLPASYNFFSPRMATNPDTKNAFILHYHRKDTLKQSPQFEDIKSFLFEKVPTHLHQELKKHLDEYSTL